MQTWTVRNREIQTLAVKAYWVEKRTCRYKLRSTSAGDRVSGVTYNNATLFGGRAGAGSTGRAGRTGSAGRACTSRAAGALEGAQQSLGRKWNNMI